MKTMLLACCLLAPAAARGAEVPRQPPAEPPREEAREAEPRSRAARRQEELKAGDLAGRYEVEPAQVLALRRRGLGWGSVENCLAVSRRSGRSVEEVLALWDSGMGWGEIAHSYGFKLGEAIRRAPEKKRGRGEQPGEEGAEGLRDAPAENAAEKERERDLERERERERSRERGRRKQLDRR